MPDFTDILECPTTHGALRWASAHELSAKGGPAYQVRDGVARLLPERTGLGSGEADPSRSIHDFYQNDGWSQDQDGLFADTKAFVDTRRVALDFSRRCIARLGKYFGRGGQYLLDAGSGPIPQSELLAYGDRFEKRICVDLSVPALRLAQSKLGDRGEYLQADLTSLPIKTGSIDAITCNHVIYQIPAEKQEAAFCELWRVLKPGGIGVVVYWWADTPLAWRIERLARLFAGKRNRETDEATTPSRPLPVLYHHPHSLAWFQTRNWPFRYEIDTFRVINNAFTRTYVSDDWRGRAFLRSVYALQAMAPRYCGKYGVMPAIVIHKD